MVFKVDESRIRELAQIEADSNCTIGAGGQIPLDSVLGSVVLSESADRVMSALRIELPQSLHRQLEQIAQQKAGFSIDQFVAAAIAEKIAEFQSIQG
jgi:predicted HicB family RNase H-like nuclease